jgi:O-antigen/teichoic acid export membrane protein
MSITQLASGAAWNTLAKVLQLLVTLLTLAFVGRYAGPEAFGVFSLVWVVVGLIEQTLLSAIIDGLIAHRAPDERHRSSTFWVALGIAGAAALIICATATPLSIWLGGGALLATLLTCRALFLPMSCLFGVSQAVLMRRGEFKILAHVDMASNLVSAALGIYLAIAGFGVWSLLILELTRQSLQTIGQLWFARWWPQLLCSRAALRELAEFNLQSASSTLMSFAIRTTPKLLIGQALGTQALGYYTMAERLCDQVIKILVLPGYDVVKIGASRARRDTAALRQLLWGAIATSTLMAYPVLLGGCALASALLAGILGSQWLAAASLLQLMLIAALRSPMSAFYSAILIGIGKPEKHTQLQALQLLLTVLLCYFAVPFGLTALGLALVARNALIWSAATLVIRQAIKAPIAVQISAGAGHLLASLLMAAAVGVWVYGFAPGLASGAVIVGGIGLGLAVYLPALAWLAPHSWQAVQDVAARVARGERGAFKAYFVAVGARGVKVSRGRAA